MNKYFNKKRRDKLINFYRANLRIYFCMEKLDLERLILYVVQKLNKDLFIFLLPTHYNNLNKMKIFN